MADDKTTVGALMLLAGGIIGAGMALLYAPQSGERTRRQITRYAKKARNEAEEVIRDTADYLSDMLDEVTEKTSNLLEGGAEVAEDWRTHLLDSIERGQKGLERQRKKLMQKWG